MTPGPFSTALAAAVILGAAAACSVPGREAPRASTADGPAFPSPEDSPLDPTRDAALVNVGGMVLIPGETLARAGGVEPFGVAPFLLDVTEVTVAAYEACVQEGRCSASTTVDGFGVADSVREKWAVHCNWGRAGRREHPMNCVEWAQAAAYCSTQGKRLPTEEEWEWAARGASRGMPFPWGRAEPADQLCWSGRRSRAADGTCPVGSFPEGMSPQGARDLAGNVWEWTAAPDTAPTRAFRGGCWGSTAAYNVSASGRMEGSMRLRGPDVGFRCARTP
jgi:formylglycine-generating enzyme required for sulfatase activity